ncbi:histone-lysine N-methyltransferase SETMAR [Trichonephila clavipes]|nr:histone-lysine N-methyltransferase SETMAR [Trichonephila clavipes]
MEVNKDKIRFFLQFFFDKGENASQGAEIANGVYSAGTVTATYVQFWFHRFRSGIFDFKDASRTSRPVIKNMDKITEIIEVHRHLAIDQKWPELVNRRGAVFHQNNARTHTSVLTRHDFWDLGWRVLMHPPYSPDLAPSDYYLFLALQNFLSDKKWGSREDCENRLLDVFINKSQDFYERGIIKPPLNWQ